MKKVNSIQTTELQAMRLVAQTLGIEPLIATHQTFGHNSVTFDVALPDRHVMLRTNTNPQVFTTTENNIAILAELGLPVPNVLATDLTRSHVPFAYMILDKIPGRDLRYDLSAMTPAQMTCLAEQIVGFQKQVAGLPQGSGYGYVGLGERGQYDSWWDVICSAHQHRTAKQEEVESDEVVEQWQNRIHQQIERFEPYLRSVPPTCFLDDITVKNVIVRNGELEGLVDFDCVCYGDPLYWLALTATGVMSDVGTRGLFYVEELKRLWKLTREQEQVLVLYSAAMALDFLRRFSTSETQEWRVRMLEAVEGGMSLVEQGR